MPMTSHLPTDLFRGARSLLDTGCCIPIDYKPRGMTARHRVTQRLFGITIPPRGNNYFVAPLDPGDTHSVLSGVVNYLNHATHLTPW